MGRPRKNVDPDEPLPKGLYKDGRQFRTRLLNGPWQYFGTDYAAAITGFKAWKRDGPTVNTVAWLLDLFTGQACAGLVKGKKMAPRTAKDYWRDAIVLKAGLGACPLSALKPHHIVEFSNARAQAAPSHVRNELACLSSALTWAVKTNKMASNPCLLAGRPSKTRRMRLITDAEYLKVYQSAGASVRLAMALAVRTLALPGDLLAMGPMNVINRKTLRFQRGKTGVAVEIELVGELARLIDDALSPKILLETFLHTRRGKPYTRDGITSMFRRHCIKAGVTDFGLRDLRAKGATDMYKAGTDIRHLQHLLGHLSVRTTEIYIKSLVPEVVRPNELPIVASME